MGKIAVFCSSSSDIDPEFFEAAEGLGRWIGRNGHTLVFGGCNLGLMECVARATRLSGGMAIGVIPASMVRGGLKSDHVDVTIPTDNLGDRKEMMMAQGDAFVALPGGVGTLDEVFTVAAAATAGYHSKRVILLNAKGFWNPLVALMESLVERGTAGDDWRGRISVAESLGELTLELGKELGGA